MDKELKRKLAIIAIGTVELLACFIATRLIKMAWYVQVLIYLVPYFTVGHETVKEAFENLFHGKMLDENFLMTVATVGAFVLADYTEAVFVMLFYQVGEFFEEMAEDKSRKSISDLMELCPDTATVIRNGEEVTVKPEEIKIGEIVVVKPGEKIPTDGKIIKGNTEIDTVALTGETMPQYAEVGSSVVSGCVNISGVIYVEAEKEFGESTASKILELVENASETKSKSENFITRFAKVYTPAVVILAVLISVVPPIFNGAWGEWVNKGIKMLVVSCPCALVLSVPLAYFAGIGKASKHGILIKGAEYLEKIAEVDTVVMDKTGTVTEGVFSVKKTVGREDTLKIAASVETHTTHPIGKSLAEAQGDDIYNVENIKEYSGKGITAEYCGKRFFAGNEKLLRELNVKPMECSEVGTKVFVGENDECIGIIILQDKIKENARNAIDLFKKMNIKTAILTGDAKNAAMAVAEELKIDKYFAELLPQNKVDIYGEITKESRCNAFVGDGINDAPVIRKADVGIAMGAFGSDAAIEAADIVLMNDDICNIPTAITISKKTNKIVKENIIASITVKIAVLVLCVLNIAPLGMAVFADVGVLVLSILNSIRLMKD